MESSKSNTTDRELRLTRTLDAPIELVWEAWTKPEHIAQWWGPNDFTTTISKMNLEPEGEWTWYYMAPTGPIIKTKAYLKRSSRSKKSYSII